MYAEVMNYINLLDKIGDIIKNSKFKTEYIIKALGMKKATFYDKIKKKNFTPHELLGLSKVLYPEEAQASEIKELIDKSREQYKAGLVKEHEQVIKESIERYGQ